MLTWAVVFTTYLCPGAIKVLGISIQLASLPDSLKPALAVVGACQARPAVELYDPARLREARARVLALGKPAQIYPIQDGVAVGDPFVEWSTAATFKESQ